MKSNKSDFLDAEAIAEAVDRQNMASTPPVRLILKKPRGVSWRNRVLTKFDHQGTR